MFSDRSASQLHLFADGKKWQIPRKGHQIRGCRFFPATSRVRPKPGQTQAKSQPKNDEKSMPTPPTKQQFSMHPPRASPKSLPHPKRSLSGGARAVPGGSREVPESSPSPPGASPGRLRSTPGARPERPTRATGHRRPQNAALGPQKAHSGGLRDLILEPPRPVFRHFMIRSLVYVRWPQLANAAPNRTSQFPGGGGESPQASSIAIQ